MPARKMGTWKLAYADFLTALAAFFLLMWLISGVSKEDRALIAAEFTGKPAQTALTTGVAASEAEQLAASLALSGALATAGDSLRVSAEASGVRVELVDTASRPLFDTGHGALSADGMSLIQAVAGALHALPFEISIEGHTDAFSMGSSEFSNWELSSSRANEARRALEAAGIAASRIRAVTGYADTRPLREGQPHLAANRRISLEIHLAP